MKIKRTTTEMIIMPMKDFKEKLGIKTEITSVFNSHPDMEVYIYTKNEKIEEITET